MSKVLRSDEFIAAVCKALNISTETIQGVIIEARIGDYVHVYTTHAGTRSLLTIDWDNHLKTADISDESESVKG